MHQIPMCCYPIKRNLGDPTGQRKIDLGGFDPTTSGLHVHVHVHVHLDTDAVLVFLNATCQLSSALPSLFRLSLESTAWLSRSFTFLGFIPPP